MASASSPQVVRTITKSPVKAPKGGSSNVLRAIAPLEANAWSQAFNNASIMNYIFLSLEDSLEYPFQDQDPVWIRTQGHNWVFGKVAGRNIRVGQTRYRREGLFYPVNFGIKFNLRKYFAPTNAEIKPDTEEVRQLLREEGWLDSGDSTVSDGSEYTE